MGKGKIKIEINRTTEKVNKRKVSFTEKREGLFKKAHELSVLCDSEIGVIVYSSSGDLYDFASSNMTQVLSRYKEGIEREASSGRVPKVAKADQRQEPKEVQTLKADIAEVKAKQLRLMGKDLTDMSLNELEKLQYLLNEGLLSVKEKERLLLEQSRLQLELSECPEPAYHSTQTKTSVERDDVLSPDTNESDSITTLRLWPPSPSQKKAASEHPTTFDLFI